MYNHKNHYNHFIKSFKKNKHHAPNIYKALKYSIRRKTTTLSTIWRQHIWPPLFILISKSLSRIFRTYPPTSSKPIKTPFCKKSTNYQQCSDNPIDSIKKNKIRIKVHNSIMQKFVLLRRPLESISYCVSICPLLVHWTKSLL